MISISSYALKNHFQRCLEPVRDWLITLGISPNQVTLASCFLCLIYAFFLSQVSTHQFLLVCMPLFLFVRMALNALDGMMATISEQKTAWGAVLNELCDVISDSALFLAFIFLIPTHSVSLLILLFAGIVIEFTSLAVYQAVQVRPYSGPFAKSDRAIFMGCLALMIACLSSDSILIEGLLWLGFILSLITFWNRIMRLNE